MFQEDIKVGDTIRFGTIYGEAVEWRVLRVWKQERKALVISEKAFGDKQYHREWESTTWETCSLREWLNGKFLNDILQLTDEGKARIMTVKLENEDNPEYGTAGGNPTWDRFFLLSIREAELYFKDNEDRVCYDKYGRETVWWWLRSPGDGGLSAADVSPSGYVNLFGDFVFNAYGDVRPAFYLNLKS